MNTATLAERNTRSAVRRSSGSGRAATRYLRPRRWTADRTAISGLVSRLRFATMVRLVASLDAHEAEGAPETGRSVDASAAISTVCLGGAEAAEPPEQNSLVAFVRSVPAGVGMQFAVLARMRPFASGVRRVRCLAVIARGARLIWWRRDGRRV